MYLVGIITNRIPKTSTAEISFNGAPQAEMGPSMDAVSDNDRQEYAMQYRSASDRVPAVSVTYPPPQTYPPPS